MGASVARAGREPGLRASARRQRRRERDPRQRVAGPSADDSPAVARGSQAQEAPPGSESADRHLTTTGRLHGAGQLCAFRSRCLRVPEAESALADLLQPRRNLAEHPGGSRHELCLHGLNRPGGRSVPRGVHQPPRQRRDQRRGSRGGRGLRKARHPNAAAEHDGARWRERDAGGRRIRRSAASGPVAALQQQWRKLERRFRG